MGKTRNRGRINLMDMGHLLYVWFYRGLGGLGGWALLAGGGLASAAWVVIDSRRRMIPARLERTKIVLAQLLSVPAAVFHFAAGGRAGPPLDAAFYLGLIGGLAPPVIAAWYVYRYHDKVACPVGHSPYPATLARCPRCAQQDTITAHGHSELPPIVDDPQVRVRPPRPHAPQARAWLIGARGQHLPLYRGENMLGRGPEMHFQFVGDQAVSRRHARIMEREERFFVMDCGSTYGTRVNDRFLTPYIEEELRSGDVIEMSEFTHVTFRVLG